MSAVDDFIARFGGAPAVVAEAPGRVNLIGEHTDYNGGFVLPIAIPLVTTVALTPRHDQRVHVTSDGVSGMPGGAAAEYRLEHERASSRWIDYVQGCTAMLHEEGHPIRGFDAAVASRVPIGAGLSSSAALEVAVVRALREAFDLALDDVALALLAHRAEVEFVGARVGVMDQMASSLGDDASALFLDARSLEWERVPLPADAGIAVVDSGVAHRHAGGDYNVRRSECERAAKLLGVASLRELGTDALARAAELPPPLDRRVRHVVTENARVLAAVAALQAGDVVALGGILRAGHASLRDDYEVSVPEIERLVAAADADPDVLGARMTGGGFGGAVVLLCRAHHTEAAATRVATAYGRTTSGGRVLLPVRNVGGAP
jgi:galactokinase